MDLALQNLISPIVLCFVLGAVARWVKSDFELPDAVYQSLSIYLLLAIGLKGGVAVAQTPIMDLLGPAAVTLVLGVLTPLSAYFMMRKGGGLNQTDAAATAAHYGSVSAVTFLASIEGAKLAGLQTEGYLAALVALLEVPGIIVGLVLARGKGSGSLGTAVHDVLTGKSIFLLIGGLVIGTACGPEKISAVAPFFIDPFKGVLCLFLLELGTVAAGRMKDMTNAGWKLIALGCLIPTIHGIVGTAAGIMVGMSPGGAAVLGAMVGSASYIAAPAAVRIALPEASPGIYLTLALGITFPFNLLVGIPLFMRVASWLSNIT
ncbi:MAG: sodium-dependent bicarbonate transport family permease [Verrucomicrobiae bacterium]|nr:sodium-dependent bicarbonate transport family permease [Verrucomicrobiae bacterium]NNJ42432.1 sodium-dependent bicarbonate transport family permease [Akkermansiaceae bacterium]